MSKAKITILCTKDIDEAFVKYAASKNILVDVSPFIRTAPVSSIEVQREIEHALMLSANVVFTSVNAVHAVAANVDGQKPGWHIFCIGRATCKSCEKYFGKEMIAAIADNAGELAHSIIDARVNAVIFFCNNIRRNALPNLLKKHNIEVHEIVVYETLTTPHKVEKSYNGILFFSPSAVQSFFEDNLLNDQTILFAIGDTTADEIAKHSQNKMVVSDEPEKKILLEKVIDYFQANPIYN